MQHCDSSLLCRLLSYPASLYSFLPSLALGSSHPPSYLSLHTISLFILTLGFNYSFVVIVFIIVWIVIIPCFCCQEQVVDGTCKGSLCVSACVCVCVHCDQDIQLEFIWLRQRHATWWYCFIEVWDVWVFLKDDKRAQTTDKSCRHARRRTLRIPHEWYMPPWSYSNRTPH